jgi:hypothetical protein
MLKLLDGLDDIKKRTKVLSRMRCKPHVRLCVQRRLACSGGGKPPRGKARALELGEQGDGKPTF